MQRVLLVENCLAKREVVLACSCHENVACLVPLLSLVSEDFAWCKRCTWMQDDASPFKCRSSAIQMKFNCHSTWFKHDSNVTRLLSTHFLPQALPSLLIPCHFEAWWIRRERSWKIKERLAIIFCTSKQQVLYGVEVNTTHGVTSPKAFKASCESYALLLWSSFTLVRSRCTSACLRSASWPWSIPLESDKRSADCGNAGELSKRKATKPWSHKSWTNWIFEVQTKSSLIFLLPGHSLMVCTLNVQSKCSTGRSALWLEVFREMPEEAKVTLKKRKKNEWKSHHCDPQRNLQVMPWLLASKLCTDTFHILQDGLMLLLNLCIVNQFLFC